MQDTLSDEEGFEVAGQAADGVEAVRGGAGDAAPTSSSWTCSLPGKDGATACREIIELLPDVRVLMLTASAEEDDVIRAVAAGATGFVQKFTGSDELVHAVREVAAGNLMIPDDAVRRAFRLLGEGYPGKLGPDVLSARERERR